MATTEPHADTRPLLHHSTGRDRRSHCTIAHLNEQRIVLRAMREGIDTATSAGRAVAAIMATLAELELELGRERPRSCS